MFHGDSAQWDETWVRSQLEMFFFSRGELSFLCFSLGTENHASLFVEPTKEKVHPAILLDPVRRISH